MLKHPKHPPKSATAFPIIGFYLYHVISADQSNNWTTSGIWSCNNLLLILHAFHLYSRRLKHQTKGKWQLYVPQLHMMTKRVNFISNLSNLRWTKPWRLLFKWYVYQHIFRKYFHCCWLVLTFPTRMSKLTQKSVCLYAIFFRERISWSIRWYTALYALEANDYFYREASLYAVLPF